MTPRPLAVSDAREVAALVRLCFARHAGRADPPPSALRETTEGVAVVLAAGGGFGAAATDRLVGAVLWQERDGGLYASRLCVHPDWRGRGIARSLIEAVAGAAIERGLRHLRLSTRLAFADNRALFASCGFREKTLESHPGYDAPTFVNLERVLD